jgi:hypothetical protein
VSLFIFLLYLFAPRGLACDAMPRRETHCRTRAIRTVSNVTAFEFF